MLYKLLFEEVAQLFTSITAKAKDNELSNDFFFKSTFMLNFICSPIGNLNDISMRSISLLESADFIYAEDTRNTNNLLSNFNINKKSKSFHEHNEIKITPEIINQLNDGNKIAIITDAGAPCISDPGYYLSQECIKHNIQFTVLPGPSSVINALILSGLPSDAFSFKGFFPRKKTDQIEMSKSLNDVSETIIFFESAKRLEKTISVFAEYLEFDRRIILCREMTKKYEEVIRDSVGNMNNKFKNNEITTKGEFVIVLEGSKKINLDLNLSQKIKDLYLEHLPAKDAAKLLAALTSKNKRDLYKWLIDK